MVSAVASFAEGFDVWEESREDMERKRGSSVRVIGEPLYIIKGGRLKIMGVSASDVFPEYADTSGRDMRAVVRFVCLSAPLKSRHRSADEQTGRHFKRNRRTCIPASKT